MDTTSHAPRRRFRLISTRACTAAGLLALSGGGLALAQQPAPSSGHAASLKPPQPFEEPARSVISRGAAPDSTPATPVPRSALPHAPGAGQARATRPRSVPQQQPGLIEGAWNELKGVVSNTPTAPIPRHGMRTSAPIPQQQPTAQQANGGVYAGPPAYHWYGWGTTTPGANQYAPTGQYPRGSANWYAQSGATPGAFPVPVMSPYRAEPGGEPPTYVRGTAPEITPTPITRPASTERHPELNYGATSTPISNPEPNEGTTIPLPPGPPPAVVERADYPPVIAQSGQQPSRVVQSSAQREPRTSDGVNWQRFDGGSSSPFVSPPPPKVTVIRGMEPKAQEPSLEEIVRNVCQGRATVADVRQTGPTQLVVRVSAASAADARAAFAALSDVPVLKPYKVEFEADIR